MKTHYGFIEDLENGFNPVWSYPICNSKGEDFEMTSDKDFVSCKKCLKKITSNK